MLLTCTTLTLSLLCMKQFHHMKKHPVFMNTSITVLPNIPSTVTRYFVSRNLQQKRKQETD